MTERPRRNDKTTSSFSTKRNAFAIIGVAIPVSLMLWQGHHDLQPFLRPYKRDDVVYGGSASLSVNSGERNGTNVHYQAEGNPTRGRYNVSTPKKKTETLLTTNSSLVSPPKLVLPAKEIEWIVEKRDKLFEQWLNSSHMNVETKVQYGYRKTYQLLQHGADEKSGPWLDFLVVGFGKHFLSESLSCLMRHGYCNPSLNQSIWTQRNVAQRPSWPILAKWHPCQSKIFARPRSTLSDWHIKSGRISSLLTRTVMLW